MTYPYADFPYEIENMRGKPLICREHTFGRIKVGISQGKKYGPDDRIVSVNFGDRWLAPTYLEIIAPLVAIIHTETITRGRPSGAFGGGHKPLSFMADMMRHGRRCACLEHKVPY